MAGIEWTEELSVGVPVIDGHHKRLFELLNALQAGISDAADGVVGKVLPELVDYTNYHFAEEERMMEAAGYPAIAEHLQIHRKISAQVAEMSGAYHDDPRNVFAWELFMFLSNWLVEHIQTEDFSYRPWLVKA